MRWPHPLAALLAAITLSGGCAPPVPAPPRVAPEPSAAPLTASHEADVRARIVTTRTDAASAAAGLAPLRAVPLPNGEREVRVWVTRHYEDMVRLYRLTAHDARVTGELSWWWRYAPEPTRYPDGWADSTLDQVMRFRHAGRCADFVRRAPVGGCRAQFRTAPDWAGVLRAAEAAGLWALLDGPARWEEQIGWDGWFVTVELREGRRYTVRDYWTPDAAGGADQARVIALVDAVQRVDTLLRPSAALRPYRGVTRGRYEDAFRPCGGGAEWQFNGRLPEHTNGARADTSAPERYVEVVGELSPEWLARRMRSRYTRVLRVEQVTKVASWTGRECR